MIESNSDKFQIQTPEFFSDFEEEGDSGNADEMNKEEQQALKKKIFGEIRAGIRKHEKNNKRILQYTKIAASIFLILAVNIGLWESLKLKEQIYETGANETLTIELPDGSTALLNSNSQLTYSYTWAYGFDRKVKLNGEAYFDIAKDSESRRFVINEGEAMEVEVFGTEFNFKNQTPVYKLTLIEGSVKLRYQSKKGSMNRMVVPGETVKLNIENHEIEAKTNIDPQKLLAWKARKLRMQNESLEDILDIITELYDLELIERKKQLTDQLISGSLPLTDNPYEVIQNIEVLFDTEIVLEENSIRVQ